MINDHITSLHQTKLRRALSSWVFVFIFSSYSFLFSSFFISHIFPILVINLHERCDVKSQCITIVLIL